MFVIVNVWDVYTFSWDFISLHTVHQLCDTWNHVTPSCSSQSCFHGPRTELVARFVKMKLSSAYVLLFCCRKGAWLQGSSTWWPMTWTWSVCCTSRVAGSSEPRRWRCLGAASTRATASSSIWGRCAGFRVASTLLMFNSSAKHWHHHHCTSCLRANGLDKTGFIFH